ncbi:1-phosphofructokinase, partial [Nonomuraea wenchangensis]
AWGAAAAGLPGSRMPGPADIDPVVTAAGAPDPACPLAVPFVPPADLSRGLLPGPSTTNAPAPLP